MVNKEKTKKILTGVAIASTVILSALIGAGANSLLQEPDVVRDIVYKNVTVEVPTEVIKEVEVEVEKIVEVDNGNLNLVLDEIMDEDGDVEYLIDDLDDDETDLIVDRLVFKNDAISLAEELVKANIVEYIDDEEDFFGEGDLEDYRDNDVYKVIVDEDESVFEADDFEDKEATVFVEVKLKLDNDDDKMSKEFIVEVDVEGSEVEIIDVEEKV